MMPARMWVLVLLLVTTGAWPRGAALPADKAAASTLERDYDRCRNHADVGACYDAIRWNPADPALLVALGDALLRANRPADAIRKYRRAAALAPNMRGISAKISEAEARLPAKRARENPAADRAAGGTQGRRYSNAAAETQSH